ncbi:MAG: protein-export chaperone SecB [Holosporales bacterium]|jgi:preprotein translocase subunit SecB|nr:protein-export chaperone SecB [Holosporales bacterium]
MEGKIADTMQANERRSQYPFFIQDQYVKDLTFENPNFLVKYTENPEQPEVAINVETRISKIDENNYEVVLDTSVKSKMAAHDLFILELSYAGLVSIATNIENEALEPVLFVHCPFLMFPFVRELIANMTRVGGYPPLLMEPIDFASLYIEKKKQSQQANG